MRPDWWHGREEVARRLPADWWRDVIANYANGVWPERFLGPGPWEAEKCLVPEAVLDELQLRLKYLAPSG